MGRDKGRIVVDGEPLLERTIRIVQANQDQVVVIGRECPADWQGNSVDFCPDARPGIGPLGGLTTALNLANDSGCAGTILLPCDLPHLTEELVSFLSANLPMNSKRHGAALLRRGQLEPLASFYRVSLLVDFPDLEESENRSLRNLLRRGEFGRVDLPEEHFDGLHNANRPEDLQ